MEFDSAAQVKDVGERVGRLPALCQPGLDVEVFVAADERVEDQRVDVLRLAVSANARIEISRTALDDHYDSPGSVLRMAAASERERSG